MKLRYGASALVVAATLCGPVQAQSSGGSQLPIEELRLLATTYMAIKANSVKQVPDSKLIEAAIRGMIREIDPEAGAYLTKSQVDVLSRTASQAHIGLDVTLRQGEVVVVLPLSRSPAEKAGIRPRDAIESIDGTPVRGDVQLTNELLRGPAGTRVTVGVRRAGQPLTFTVERNGFTPAKASLSMAESGIAVLSVRVLSEDTLASIAAALTEQWRQQPFRGLVLDLRRNPGGLLDTAVGLSSLFLPAGVVVAEAKGRTPEDNVVYKAEKASYTKGSDPLAQVPEAIRRLPLAVLVDEGTASGSEMVVAALKHYKRAKIIGRPTFGRSSIQMIQPFATGQAVKFTTSYWFTPSNTSVDKVGILPDVMIESLDPAVELNLAVAELARNRR
nr:S41 family peptidase [uncultured Achromobacter sp.]